MWCWRLEPRYASGNARRRKLGARWVVLALFEERGFEQEREGRGTYKGKKGAA